MTITGNTSGVNYMEIQLQWSPVAGQQGPHDVVFYAQDSYVTPASTSVTLRINVQNFLKKIEYLLLL